MLNQQTIYTKFFSLQLHLTSHEKKKIQQFHLFIALYIYSTLYQQFDIINIFCNLASIQGIKYDIQTNNKKQTKEKNE